MKKSLIALAVLAASGAAMAQSSVTLFGVVDTGVSYVNNVNNAGDKAYGLHNGGNLTSRIGFRGTEDLGGGLKAGFWLEGGLTADDGNASGLNFQRRSTISLEGNFGEVRMGRDQVAGYNKTSSYDLFGQVGIGKFNAWRSVDAGFLNADVNGQRSNNLVSYYTPNFGGLKAGISYAFDEQVGNSKAGRYIGGNVSYDNGPLSVAVSYDRLNVLYTEVISVTPPVVANAAGDRDALTVAGSYNFGVAKLSGIAQQQKYSFAGQPDSKYNNYALGVSAPVGGAGEVKLQYAMYDLKAEDAKAQQLSLGYVHNLSKRTAVYTTVAFMKNKDGSAMALSPSGLKSAAAVGDNKNQTGVQVGIRHAF